MTIKSFTNDWKTWIHSNLSNNQDPEGLFNILLNHGYDFDLIKTEILSEINNPHILKRKSAQLKLNQNSYLNLSKCYKLLMDKPNVYRIENDYLEIYKAPNFLSNEECDVLIEKISSNLKPSTITNPYGNKTDRTSLTSHLSDVEQCCKDLNFKIHDFMKIPLNKGEALQGQKYLVGQEFKPHTDYFHENEEYNKVHLGSRGQRTWTFLLYLNEVEEGGETEFPKIDLKVAPVKGTAIVWNNLLPDMTGNYYSLHSGLPVIKGEKNIITKWFRQN